MPGRSVPLLVEHFYHIYNRGSDKRDIFLKPRDYKRFKLTFYYYQFLGPKPKFSKFTKADLTSFNPGPDKKAVEIICYCLMPNHFHFLVKQLKENGISIFVSQLSNSYTKYFNTKYKRIGALFQGAFKSVLIESNEQFIHVSRYIHLNPIVSGITDDLNSYPWSSYHEYIDLDRNRRICSINLVLDMFPSVKKYQEFLQDQIGYGTTLEIIKHQTVDIDK